MYRKANKKLHNIFSQHCFAILQALLEGAFHKIFSIALNSNILHSLSKTVPTKLPVSCTCSAAIKELFFYFLKRVFDQNENNETEYQS